MLRISDLTVLQQQKQEDAQDCHFLHMSGAEFSNGFKIHQRQLLYCEAAWLHFKFSTKLLLKATVDNSVKATFQHVVV